MKFLFTFAFIAIIGTAANATVHIVTCQNNPSHFLPDTVNATVGDTIHWTWVAGTHEVGPINVSDIPSGAATWVAGPIDVDNTDFEYVVTAVGTYHYVCHPDTPHGENAYIVVTGAATGVQQYNALSNLSFTCPNPSNGKFQFAIGGSQITKNSKVEIYNLKGQIIYQSVITKTKSDIDLSDQAKGIYLVKFYTGQSVLSEKIVIQ
ncbi:T9SS type A sorting domain-containing protein [bacterium AH-315-C07]|nr:T9SS type A sorting domain-containing protein [bacterium AH-315-C07]